MPAVPVQSTQDKPHLFHWTKYRVAFVLGSLLIVSGLFHLGWLVATSAPWEGALSPRKPGLFGISAGVTIWSIAWVVTRLQPSRHDTWFVTSLAIALFVEVSLITLQFWRGVGSHFNRSTPFDLSVEATMLGLILLSTAGIGWLSFRSCYRLPIEDAMTAALRGGLWLLLVSCGLGLLTTITGEINLANHLPPEVWGRAGVLKYPHGAGLHAIQTLPLLAFVLQKLLASHPVRAVHCATAAHAVFVLFALRQALSGRSRLDVDGWGTLLLLAVAGLTLVPALALVSPWLSRSMRTNRVARISPSASTIPPESQRGPV